MLRTLLAGAAIKGWVVKQMDVTTAFLNSVLEEEIFMAQPEGFDDGSGRILKLKKALYGLKQAPRQWYLKLRGVLEEIGFTPSTADHSLFMLGEGEQRNFMVVYVDDILIFSPSSNLVKKVMLKLQDKFKCKALRDVSFYLGLHIERDVEKQCMRVHQRNYLEALAANFGQSEGHVATPFPSGFKCVKGPEEESVGEEERRRFHSLVGSLMYAAVNTRPDVAFATGHLARVVQCPNDEQVAAGMRVAKYLGQTSTVGLQYSAAAQRRQKGADGVEPGRLFLTAFSDASFASEPEDMTSVGGFICCVGGGPTAWESKKQVDQALSLKSECDHSLFLLQEKEQFLMLLVYVDDILLFSKSSAMIERVEEMLEMQFMCSKMGDVKYYLGMHVERDLDKGVLRLHQRNAVRQRLQRGAADLGKGEMLLTCYTDASFNFVKGDGTSIGGYVCLFGGGAVSWRSKKQNEVGQSSCETEYMALHHGAKEVVWLRRLLEEIGVCQKEPTVIFCDNESTVKLAKNACLHGLTKHIRPKWHWVRRLLDKEVRLEIVKTHQQAADILTKRLAESEHWKGMKLAGMSVH
ncbi:unnamed protein product [Closterium sp. NIES-54]